MITYSFVDSKLWGINGFHQTDLGHVLRRLPELGREHTCGPWVAGGAVRRAVIGEPVGKDIDVFFRSESSYELYREKIFSLDKGVTVRNDTERVLELEITGKPQRPVVLDLIHGTYFPDAGALLEDFDFTCCQFAVDQNTLYVGDLAMLHAGQRVLRANNWGKLEISYPHMVRYMHEGWRPGKNELDALLASIEKTPDILRRASKYSGRDGTEKTVSF